MNKFLAMAAMAILNGVVDFVASGKTVKFLQEVFDGGTGRVLKDEVCNIINESVKEAKEIADEAAKTDGSNEAVSAALSEAFRRTITVNDIIQLRLNPGFGKYGLAFGFIKERMEKEGLEFSEQAVNLGIELAVNRFFGKP